LGSKKAKNSFIKEFSGEKFFYIPSIVRNRLLIDYIKKKEQKYLNDQAMFKFKLKLMWKNGQLTLQ